MSDPVSPAQVIDEALKSGREIEIEWNRGGSIEVTGAATGPDLEQRGDEITHDYQFGNPSVNPETGETSAGAASGSSEVIQFFDGVTGLNYAAFGVGTLLILLAVWSLKRGRPRSAGLLAATGAGFIAGAFNPWLFLLAAAGLAAWLWYSYRSDLKRGDAQRERDSVRGTLGKVAGVIERRADADDIKREVLTATGGDKAHRSNITDAKRREGV